MNIEALMTRNVASVRRSESLSAAAQLMWQRDCGALPVIEDETGQVVGMITDRDICMASWSRDLPPSRIGVETTMSQSLAYCTPDDSLAVAENLMRSTQVRRIPILNAERKLLGILSLADIGNCCERGVSPGGAFELAPTQVTAILAQICQPKPAELLQATS